MEQHIEKIEACFELQMRINTNNAEKIGYLQELTREMERDLTKAEKRIKEQNTTIRLSLLFAVSAFVVAIVCTIGCAKKVNAAPVAGHTQVQEQHLKNAKENKDAKSAMVIEGKLEEPEAVIDYSEAEFDLLTRVVQAEAGGCTETTRLLVADVILNRVIDSNFPNTLNGVLQQSGQFASVTDGGIYRHVPSDTTIEICKDQLQEIDYPGVIYFRENYYEWGTPWKMYDGLYFSTK